MLETQQFTVVLTHLPRITEEYPLEKLKSDLWDHLTYHIGITDQQIKKLEKKDHEERIQEIVDIQFAMSDYEYLNYILNIKEISGKI